MKDEIKNRIKKLEKRQNELAGGWMNEYIEIQYKIDFLEQFLSALYED